MKHGQIDKEFLEREYILRRKSMKAIARENGASVGLVHKRIHDYGIEPRKELLPEVKKRMGDKARSREHRSGFHLSQETKDKLSKARTGEYTHPSKYGGHVKNRTDGYNSVYIPGHHRASKDGYVLEHICVMEDYLGRELTDDEVVHHINHNRRDNRPENLRVMTKHDHTSMHMKERWEMKRRCSLLTK